MQAITTRYLPPTNHKGSRIVAECAARRMYVAWDYALNVDDNHAAACRALAAASQWTERGWVGGVVKSGDFVWVRVTGRPHADMTVDLRQVRASDPMPGVE